MKRAKLVEDARQDVRRYLDRWEIFGICLGIAGVMVLGFAFYQAFLLLVDIVNAPAGEAHLIEKGMR